MVTQTIAWQLIDGNATNEGVTIMTGMTILALVLVFAIEIAWIMRKGG
jgi:hypothetical protein